MQRDILVPGDAGGTSGRRYSDGGADFFYGSGCLVACQVRPGDSRNASLAYRGQLFILGRRAPMDRFRMDRRGAASDDVSARRNARPRIADAYSWRRDTCRALRPGNHLLWKFEGGVCCHGAVFVLATMSFSLRPQMLGYFFLILTLIALELFRKGERRAVWGLPVLMLIWVNAHGSWIIGLGVIGVYLACGLVEFRAGDVEARRWSPSQRLQLAIVFALCACATLITPYGAGLAKFPFQFAFSLPVSVANISEWQAMPFNLIPGKVFLVFLLGIIVFQVGFYSTWRFEDLTLFLFACDGRLHAQALSSDLCARLDASRGDHTGPVGAKVSASQGPISNQRGLDGRHPGHRHLVLSFAVEIVAKRWKELSGRRCRIS